MMEFFGSWNILSTIIFGSVLMWIYTSWKSMRRVTKTASLVSFAATCLDGIMAVFFEFDFFLRFSIGMLVLWAIVTCTLTSFSVFSQICRNRATKAAIDGAIQSLVPGAVAGDILPSSTTNATYADATTYAPNAPNAPNNQQPAAKTLPKRTGTQSPKAGSPKGTRIPKASSPKGTRIPKTNTNKGKNGMEVV